MKNESRAGNRIKLMEQGCWKIDLLSEENVTPPNLNIRKNKLISWESKESLEIKSELNK